MKNVSQSALRELRKVVSGSVITPAEEGYDEARRLFNAMIDRRPALFVRCQKPDDVAAAIRFARSEELPLAIRGGGHSVAGMSLVDGGVVVDLRAMKDLSVDPSSRTIRIGGGCLWGEVDRAAQAHGMATTGGRNSVTGVAGLVLGGGSGWLERRYGLACDNLVSVELVTADGSRVRASAGENSELFWGLHGAGGNFGVATAIELELHPMGPEVLAGLLLYEPDRGREMLTAWRDVIQTGPEELGGAFVYLTAPDDPAVPADHRGKLVSCIVVCWSGDPDRGAEVIAPFLKLKPIANFVQKTTYVDFQCSIDDPPGFRNYWTAEYLNQLSAEAVDTIIAHSMKLSLGPAQSFTVPWGGAVARVPEGATPLSKRDAAFVVHPFALWADAADDQRNIGWARAFAADVRRLGSGGTYLNWIGNEGEERIRAAYGAAKYARLQSIKAEYDPDNVFRANQNIRPASG